MACGQVHRWPNCAIALCGIAAALFLGTTGDGAGPAGETTAERLVSSAMQAESEGDLTGRATALQGAIQIAPEYKLPRWHLGQIELGGKWHSVDEAQQQAAANPRLSEYRALREKLGDEPQGQLTLARWCAKHGLEEEARFHWASVLAVEPNQPDAQRALGVRWFNGQLLTSEQITEAKEQNRSAERALRIGKTRLAAWERELGGDLPARTAALNEIRSLDSPDAIPAIETATLREVSTDPQIVRCRLLSMALFQALDGMSDQVATESLVRHAVLSSLPSAKNAAISRLKERSMHDYVPHLLDGLTAPVTSWFGVVTGPDGSVHYRHALYREGPFADVSFRASRSVWRQPFPQEVMARIEGIENTSVPTLAQMDRAVLQGISRNVRRFTNRFGQQAFETERQVAEFNGSVGEMNEKIVPVLAQTTGQDFGNAPRQWWDWWQDYNGYENSYDRPVYDYGYEDQQSYTVPTLVPRGGGGGSECFVRGTPVWTKTGPRPIETLRMGDIVLAQNVDTGELAYKPVVGTTVRPPSPMVKLTIGKEQIVTTIGHPFWVAGTGWRMAKELADGAVLHGVKLPARVSAAAPAEQAESYNLVVAEFATYFVGEQGILVHDNTPRRPTPAVVPGLVEK